jgi:hypothetical protein
MGTIGGGILLALGCLFGLATIVCAAAVIGWLPPDGDPGELGVFTLAMVAFAGWAGLALVTGIFLLRRRSLRSRRWVVLAASICGTLLGYPVHLIAEYEKPSTSTSLDEFNAADLGAQKQREETRFRAFGTELKVEREPRVRWTDERGQTRLSRPSGENAQFMALFAGIAVAYSIGGGLICGSLAAFIAHMVGARAPTSNDKH